MFDIEEYIKKNRDKLDTEEPAFNHEDRFEKKLEIRFHTKDKFIIRYALAVAASVIIFLATSVYVYHIKSQGYKGAMETGQSVELIETEQYYSEQTEKALAKLKQTISTQPKNVTSPLLSELDEMEASYHQLKKDLDNNPNDIRLISAVVQYHQLKLDLINNLIERFTLYTNNKNQRHEKSNI